jgi:hypothetical protein
VRHDNTLRVGFLALNSQAETKLIELLAGVLLLPRRNIAIVSSFLSLGFTVGCRRLKTLGHELRLAAKCRCLTECIDINITGVT